VWADEDGNAHFKCWSRGCSTRDILAALGHLPAVRRSAAPAPRPKPADEKDRVNRARRIWRGAHEPRGTTAQDYLFGRGLKLAIPASIRFHPRLWYSRGVFLPAMVAAIEDLEGRIVAIHRTYLKPDGTSKADVEDNKKALGPYHRRAVHLT